MATGGATAVRRDRGLVRQAARLTAISVLVFRRDLNIIIMRESESEFELEIMVN